MTAYSIYDAIEEKRNEEEAIKTLQEEKEAELSEWFSQSIKPRFIQEAVITALGGKADEAAVNNAFDICNIEERTAKYINSLADEIAFQQIKINKSFHD